MSRPKVQTLSWQCRYCGCSDDQACPGGCSWVAPNVCSRCAGTLRDDANREMGLPEGEDWGNK